MLNLFIQDSRNARQDIEKMFSFLGFIILSVYLPWIYSGFFSCLFWSVLCVFWCLEHILYYQLPVWDSRMNVCLVFLMRLKLTWACLFSNNIPNSLHVKAPLFVSHHHQLFQQDQGIKLVVSFWCGWKMKHWTWFFSHSCCYKVWVTLSQLNYIRKKEFGQCNSQSCTNKIFESGLRISSWFLNI